MTDILYVTPSGRVYLAERCDYRMDTLCIKYTYCRQKPRVETLNTNFCFWGKNRSKVIVTCWEYDSKYFADSAVKMGGTCMNFRKKFVEVDELFFNLLLGHCIKAGEKSFALSDIFSVALALNSKFTVNGVELGVMNRIPTRDLQSVTVAIYCMGYRVRFGMGKVVEKFTTDEKKKASRIRGTPVPSPGKAAEEGKGVEALRLAQNPRTHL